MVRTQTLVDTDRGTVAGVEDRGVFRFRGIPFAASPFGLDRLRPPAPVARWDGVREAVEVGLGVPQGRFPDDPLDAYFNPARQGEDCLNLEIVTPDPGAAGLPVMMWIHGGGFITGTGSAPAHDGLSFARDGVVHVGINYRLGADGFTYFDDGIENLGLLDQIAALEWVQRNIAAFGGDPDQVTIAGQSAGAIAVLDLMAMPAADGLFARAIAMSGSPVVSVNAEAALRATRRFAERLGVEPTREAFAALPLDRLVSGTLPMAMDFMDFTNWGAESFTVSPFRAVHGTESMPLDPLAAAAGSGVPLLTGTTRNETSGFMTALGLLPELPPEVGESILALLGADTDVRRGYSDRALGLEATTALVEAAWTDWVFRIPTLGLVDRRVAAHKSPSYVYEFHWESPSLPPGLGANHALDVPFMRDDLETIRDVGPAGAALVGGDAPQRLAAEMHRAFTDFVRTGDPGWTEYDATKRPTMVFDADSAVRNDPAASERHAWAGKR
ncbi:carboxylesterase/lipase family protein [Nocardioides sp. NPDC101246]|uniref:carboxylesterase/lipase family protein n=1 Tax=Nocardioides sp. NPDC101246 TaxID=3364336 RepID=UPI003804C9B1